MLSLTWHLVSFISPNLRNLKQRIYHWEKSKKKKKVLISDSESFKWTRRPEGFGILAIFAVRFTLL